MNNPSPLIPQGSLLDQKNQGRARVRIAVFVVLAIHGVGLLALLMQGCKPSTPPEPPPPLEQPTAPPVEFDSNTLPPVETNAGVTAAPDSMPEAAPTNVPEALPVTAPVIAPTGSQYKIAKGDTFGAIAKKFNVSVRALTEANPTVQPTRMQIGQTIQIPAGTPAASGVAPAADAAPRPEANGQAYTVKSGDNLTKIAARYGVSVKALRAANSLRTDSIKVGQKLKIPVKASAGGTATP